MPFKKDVEKTVDVDVTIKAVADKALLVVTEDMAETWIPKSQISQFGDLGPDAKRDDSGTMIVSEWIARQKGWV